VTSSACGSRASQRCAAIYRRGPPPRATDVLSRLSYATPQLRIILVVIALFAVELVRRLVRRTSR
jgi:hypothetical protein